MPTITVDKVELFEELGQQYVNNFEYEQNHTVLIAPTFRFSTEEFDELCFEFGKYLPLRKDSPLKIARCRAGRRRKPTYG